jgi:hypothetical protein
MDRNKIENFVRFGDNHTVSGKPFFGITICYVLFSLIVFYIGFRKGGAVLGAAYLYAAVLVAYFIVLAICFFLDESKYRTRFIRNSVVSTFTSVFFLLIAIQLALITPNGNLYVVVFVLLIPLENGVIFVILLRSIKRGSYYNNKSKQKEGITAAAIWGASVSIPLSRLIFSSVSDDVAMLIAMCLMYLVAVLAALGGLNYLKLYYIHKYDIKELPKNDECQEDA